MNCDNFNRQFGNNKKKKKRRTSLIDSNENDQR